MHTPVLLQQVIESLNISAHGKYIDATFGEGGYTREIHNHKGKVLAIDLDRSQLLSSDLIKESNSLDSRLRGNDIVLVQGNFAEIEKIAKENDFFPVDGVIFDLGLSMKQYEDSKRGFSYKKLNEPLDMRIDNSFKLTARDLIKKSTINELYEIFAKNSEEIKSKEIAESIKSAKKVELVRDLIYAIDRAVGYKSSSVYARIFQALRIAVNGEFDNLKKGLEGAVNILNKNGRIVVVSFHSLEDRIVKNFVKERKLKFIEKKPIKGKRSFERSAKLRVIICS